MSHIACTARHAEWDLQLHSISQSVNQSINQSSINYRYCSIHSVQWKKTSLSTDKQWCARFSFSEQFIQFNDKVVLWRSMDGSDNIVCSLKENLAPHWFSRDRGFLRVNRGGLMTKLCGDEVWMGATIVTVCWLVQSRCPGLRFQSPSWATIIFSPYPLPRLIYTEHQYGKYYYGL